MRSKSMLSKVLRDQRAAVWYALLVVCLPLITLVFLGLVQLWQNQWLIPVSLGWLLVTSAGYALYRFWPTPSDKAAAPNSASAIHADHSDLQDDPVSASSMQSLDLISLPLRLEEREDWSAVDKHVWRQGLQLIEQTLESKPDWKALPEVCLEMLPAISQFYATNAQDLIFGNGTKNARTSQATYSFTLPELLMVLSITSSRYRQLILSHVPFADRIKVSSLLTLYSRQDQIKRGAGWINNVRRAARFVNPLAAVAAELRDHVTSKIFTNLSDNVQHDLKRLLLQELVQVSMDLYSGRLKNSAEELALYRSVSHNQDLHNRAIPAEPLRVVLMGQVSSGKSSLINALIKRLEAETDILPTTDKTTVHSLHWPSLESIGTEHVSDTHAAAQRDDIQLTPAKSIHLIDTVGLRDKDDSILAGLAIAREADLLIWVMRATQPARAPDVKLMQAMEQAFSKEPDRKRPPTLLVLTHIDQLSPKALWEPPYELNGDDPKALNINKALESCKHQLKLPVDVPAVPISLSPDKTPYNVDLVAAQIMQMHTQATQTQLNRRRTEHSGQTATWRERWDQASALGIVTGKAIIRAVIEQK